jgi:hypothetical protein
MVLPEGAELNGPVVEWEVGMAKHHAMVMRKEISDCYRRVDAALESRTVHEQSLPLVE